MYKLKERVRIEKEKEKGKRFQRFLGHFGPFLAVFRPQCKDYVSRDLA